MLLDALRRAAPAELQDRMTALIREALLTLRSLIDWYLERLDRPRGSRRSRTSRSISPCGIRAALFESHGAILAP